MRSNLVDRIVAANTGYTVNLMKGGAMARECAALLQEWRKGESLQKFVARVQSVNLLGKATRSRVGDIVRRVYARRFLASSLPAAQRLQPIARRLNPDRVLMPLMYYHTALAEPLLFDFACGPLATLKRDGREYVCTSDAVEFINHVTATGAIPKPWSPHIQVRVARGMLSALRDFGILEGRTRKRFAAYVLPWEAAAYIAYHLRELQASASEVLNATAWRLFLLSDEDVRDVLLRVQQEGYLLWEAVGSVARIEWKYPTLDEVVHAIVSRENPAA